MYKSLILNTIISAVAYFIISVVGIAVVGLLASNYGLAYYGLIALARNLLPTGFSGLLDLGASENATHSVATARATNDWDTAGAMLAALIILSIAVSIPFSISVFFASDSITSWFGVDLSERDNFAGILRYIAAIIPITIIGLIAEGAIKGLERYGIARGIEVSTSLFLAIGCYLYIISGYSYVATTYFIISLALFRALLAILTAIICFRGSGLSFRKWKSVGLPRAWKRICVTAPNKFINTLQTQSQPFVISIFLGSTSVAVYDLLMRLPRFVKSIFGLLNSAVIPFISRLEAEERKKDTKQVVENGLLLIAYLSFPPLFAAASFSAPILQLWIGESVKSYWIWQSIAFSIPLITVLLGFGFNALFGRTHVYHLVNKIAVFRLTLQYVISFLAISMLEERAFILGVIIATIATSFYEFRLIFKEHSVDSAVIRKIIFLTITGLLLTVLTAPFATSINSVIALAISAMVYSSSLWLLAWFFVIPANIKEALIHYKINSKRTGS